MFKIKQQHRNIIQSNDYARMKYSKSGEKNSLYFNVKKPIALKQVYLDNSYDLIIKFPISLCPTALTNCN